jgi:subfamily B ATP-binding cassette protein MsbA
VGATSGAAAWLVKPVLDDVFINADEKMLYIMPVALIALYFAKGLCRYLQSVLMTTVGETVIFKVRNDLMENVQYREMGFFDRNPTGELLTKLMTDVTIMQGSIPSIVNLIREVITALGLLVVLFARNWELALVAILLAPPAIIPLGRIAKKLKKVAKRSMEESGTISRVIIESFSGIEVVKAFNREQTEMSRFREQGALLLKLSIKRVKLNAISSPFMEFLGGIGAAGIIFYGGKQVLEGTTTAGSFFSFMTALFMMYDPLKKATSLNNHLHQALASADRVFELLDEPKSPCEHEGDAKLEGDIEDVSFEDVTFSYDTDREKVLDGVSFTTPKGSITAFVGESGSGKSTILKLLPRFYAVEGGAISINGRDIREYDVHDLRSRMAIVTQNTFLFDDTIESNIRMGKPDATREEVVEAAKMAYAHNFIEELPEGYETEVGQRGDLLSGGQKQRIAIARAILRDAPILILDEATSSLDSEAEREIQAALNKLMEGRTTFAIAHRLSTVIHADQILFIKEGVVTERGKHDELYAQGGDYARLCRIQFAGE